MSTKLTLTISVILAAVLTLGAWLIWRDMDAWAVEHFRDAWATPAGHVSFQEARQSMRRTFLVTGAGAILLAAVAMYLAIRRVTTPLDKLAQAALRFGAGQLDERVPVRAADEVGVLAEAFNRMAASLRSYQDTLEQKVEARSRELEASQRQLLQAGKLASIGELASGLAHELNNPTGIILMRATRLAQEIEQRQLSIEAGEDVEVIKRQVEKISRIVSGLLTFSRRSGSALRPVDINDVVRRTVLLIEDTIGSRGVEVTLELEPTLPRVEADGGQLEQVLLNLVNNALDAMPEGGRISFRTGMAHHSRCGRSARVEVEDTGIGIPAEDLPRVFDPFFTTKEVGQGTGLGLSLSYGIVEEHGGAIDVESRPGEGTCFALYLPAIEAMVSPAHRQREDTDGK